MDIITLIKGLVTGLLDGVCANGYLTQTNIEKMLEMTGCF